MKTRIPKPHSKVSRKATRNTDEAEIRNYLLGLLRPGGVTAEMTRLQTEFSTLRNRHRKNLRMQLVEAYALSHCLEADSSAWVEFCSLPLWLEQQNRPNLEKQENALRYVMTVLVGNTGRASRQKASKYYSALSELRELRVQPNAALQTIKRAGGIEKLAKASAARRRAAVTPAQPAASEDVEVRLLMTGAAATAFRLNQSAKPFTIVFQTRSTRGNAVLVNVKRIDMGGVKIYPL